MTPNDDQRIGEMHAMMIEAKEQRAKLFDLVQEVREKGCVVGKQNAGEIGEHEQRITSLERAGRITVIVGVVVVCALFGVDKVMGWLG